MGGVGGEEEGGSEASKGASDKGERGARLKI